LSFADEPPDRFGEAFETDLALERPGVSEIRTCVDLG
jgi:hypothetical protein